MTDEVVDNNSQSIILVDPSDREIGIIDKISAHQYAMLHRAYSILLFRKSGPRIETLLQKRHSEKYHGGGLWTNTCCSHPHPGEEMIATAQNRLEEEMGIVTKLHEVGTFHYTAKMSKTMFENEIDHVLVGTYQLPHINFNKLEVEDVKWMDVDSLQEELILYPSKYTPWFEKALSIALASELISQKYS